MAFWDRRSRGARQQCITRWPGEQIGRGSAPVCGALGLLQIMLDWQITPTGQKLGVTVCTAAPNASRAWQPQPQEQPV